MAQNLDVKDALGSEPTFSQRVHFESQMSRKEASRRPLALETYNFGNERRGTCLIINNQHFDRHATGQLDRDGTEVDASALESVFLSLGFDVMRHDDLTAIDLSITLRQVASDDHSNADCVVCVLVMAKTDMFTGRTDGCLLDIASDDHTNADCFACVLLSHGENGYVYGTNRRVSLDIASDDHSNADCFACVLLSHGEDGYVYGTNGRVPLDSLFKSFKGDVCPSLAGKPKLFFIQACRGRKYDWGVEVADALSPNETDAQAACRGRKYDWGVEVADALSPDETDAQAVIPNTVNKIPVEADFLFAYSVTPGYFSWRNNVDGSWFIQALSRVFREFGEEYELQQLMTLVARSVAFDFESCTDDDFTSGMKQVPCIVSTLTKQVFFKPKY